MDNFQFLDTSFENSLATDDLRFSLPLNVQGTSTSVPEITATSILRCLDDLLVAFRLPNQYKFRAMMGATGSLLTGSAVLSLLDPGRFAPRDLDLFIRPSGIVDVLLFLLNYGYSIKHIRFNSTYLDNSDPQTLTISLRQNIIGRYIDVTIWKKGDLISGITKSSSTIVMNYVSWYGLVSLYGPWTFANYGLVSKTNEGVNSFLTKYKDRGYFLTDDASLMLSWPHTADGQLPIGEKVFERHLLDGMTKMIPFDNFPSELNQYEVDVVWQF